MQNSDWIESILQKKTRSGPMTAKILKIKGNKFAPTIQLPSLLLTYKEKGEKKVTLHVAIDK